MDKGHKYRLQTNTEYIVRNFDVTHVIDKLLQQNVINSELYETLTNDSKYPTVTEKNRVFMSHLPRCGPTAYKRFLNTLSENYDYIIKRLEETEIKEDTEQATRWRCTECKNINSQRENECLGCNEPRTYPFEDRELSKNSILTQPPKKVLEANDKTSSQPKHNERRIIVIGKTGMGKSATCNSLIGREVFKSAPSFDHVTKECFFAKAERRFDQQIFDIHVYDTPGALGDGFDPDALAQALGKAILVMTPGVHCFILVSKLTRAEGENEMIKLYEKVFGKDFYKHMIGIFTEKDLLKGEQYKSVQDILKKPSSFHESLQNKISNRYLWFNCKAKGGENDQQLREFVKAMDDMNEKITGADFYSNELFAEAQHKKEQRVNEIERERGATREEAENIAEEEASSDSDDQPTWVKQFIAWLKGVFRKTFFRGTTT